jgi:hypothetical protein
VRPKTISENEMFILMAGNPSLVECGECEDSQQISYQVSVLSSMIVQWQTSPIRGLAASATT